jgi:transcription elongation GreA/GreB family factor
MSGLIENIKTKISEARAAMTANANAKYTEALKAEVETHITEMDALLKEVEAKGDQSNDELKQKVGVSIGKLETMLKV